MIFPFSRTSCGGKWLYQFSAKLYLMLVFPRPSYGGKYCLGERKRYRICNTEDCSSGNNEVSFRQQQCTEYNYIPYKNGLYEWEAVPTPCRYIAFAFSRCTLHAPTYIIYIYSLTFFVFETVQIDKILWKLSTLNLQQK